MRAIHGTRRRSFKVDAFAVVAAAVAGALELVFAGLPIRRAAEMRAASVDDKHAIGRAVHPDTIFLLPFGVDAECIVRGIANFEDSGRFKEGAGEEEFEEGDEPCTKESGDGNPHQAPALAIDFALPATNGDDCLSHANIFLDGLEKL